MADLVIAMTAVWWWWSWCSVGLVVSGQPLHIRSGLNAQHHQEAAALGKMQLANYEADEGFNRGEERQFAIAQDSNMFREGSQEGHKYGDEEFKQSDGASISNEGSNVGHKKGHQTSGFHHTYHKDESGSNSSYFDEAIDAGDRYNRNRNQGQYADNLHRQQHASHAVDAHHSNDNQRKGYFENDAQGEVQRKQLADGGHQAQSNVVLGKMPQWTQAGQFVPPQPPPHGAHYQPPPYDRRISIYDDPAYGRSSNYRHFDRFYERPGHYSNYDYY